MVFATASTRHIALFLEGRLPGSGVMVRLHASEGAVSCLSVKLGDTLMLLPGPSKELYCFYSRVRGSWPRNDDLWHVTLPVFTCMLVSAPPPIQQCGTRLTTCILISVQHFQTRCGQSLHHCKYLTSGRTNSPCQISREYQYAIQS